MTHSPPPRRGAPWSTGVLIPIICLLVATAFVHLGMLIAGLCGVGR